MAAVDTRRETLRETSRQVFGQAHRLEVMLAVARSDDGIVCLTELAKALEVSVSSLQKPFQALVHARLISPLPDADSRYRFYTRNPSAAWAWAEELALLD